MTYIVFGLFTLMVLGGGLMVVTQRNLVRAASALILSLFGVAGLYVLLNAGFLAAIQILVYIGAIAILIIFVVMLTRRIAEGDSAGTNSQWGLALVVALGFMVLMVVIINMGWGLGTDAGDVPALAEDATRRLGLALVDPAKYVLPFEIASILLLGAMVGSIVIAREKRQE